MAEAAAIDPNRPTQIVVVGYILLAVFVGLFLENAVAKLFDVLRINDASIIGDAWRVSSLLAYALAAAIAIGAYFHPTVNRLSYEVAIELKKVTW